MPIVRCAALADLEVHLSRLVQERSQALLLFFGSEDPQTGTSWCPDCVIADPLLRRLARELQPTLDLIECPVGARSAWKEQPGHPYRLHPLIHLQRIPTLIHLQGGCEQGRLVEVDCAQPELVRAFLRGAASPAQAG
jgi:thiol-disulfide isomerase/thioredoxin